MSVLGGEVDGLTARSPVRFTDLKYRGACHCRRARVILVYFMMLLTCSWISSPYLYFLSLLMVSAIAVFTHCYVTFN